MSDATPAPPAAFAPADPGFAERVRASFARQAFMGVVGATIVRIEPGTVDLELAHDPRMTQQHGFLHGGVVAALLDTACGYAASSLMPADAGVLTVEFKVNFMAPGRGDRFRFRGRVRRAGRTLTFTDGEAIAFDGGTARTIATLQATMMTVLGRDDVRQ